MHLQWGEVWGEGQLLALCELLPLTLRALSIVGLLINNCAGLSPHPFKGRGIRAALLRLPLAGRGRGGGIFQNVHDLVHDSFDIRVNIVVPEAQDSEPLLLKVSLSKLVALNFRFR